jgi:hypothetical protein
LLEATSEIVILSGVVGSK